MITLRGAAAHAGKGMDVGSVLCLGFCSRPQRLSGALPERWVRVGSGWDGVQLVSLVSVVFGKAVALPLLYYGCTLPSLIRRFVPSRVLFTYMFVPHPQPAPHPSPSSFSSFVPLLFLRDIGSSCFNQPICAVAPHSAHCTEHALPRPFRSAGL